MPDTEQVLNWKARGYFRFPFGESPPGVDARFLPDWRQFEHHLEQSKAGRFASASAMWSTARNAGGWQVAGAYCYLIGHTAPIAFLHELRAVALDPRDLGAAVDAARVLAVSGLLSEVPPILAFIREFLDIGEFQGAFWDIARLLDDGTKPFAKAKVLQRLEEEREYFPEYAAQVGAACSALTTQLGTDRAHVFRGALFDARAMTERILGSLGRGGLDPKLREIFEAATGVDCSDVSVGGRGRRSRIDAFLNTIDEGKTSFVPGRRYFFGHPVPD